jgi:hypothetical protein
VALYLAQVRLPYKTGASEDVAINAWWFIGATGLNHAAAADEIHFVLRENFYQPLGAFFSSVLSPVNEIRVYDMDPPPPHVPEIRPMDVVFGGPAVGNLPEECAIVLTFHSGEPYTPRTRGRLYMGPLAYECLESAETGPCRVAAVAMQAFADRAETVRTYVGQVSWVQHSQTTDTARIVAGGWVDDSFDTQRRRGVTGVTRHSFGASPTTLPFRVSQALAEASASSGP